MLDRALLRRFDAVIEYGLPTQAVAEQVLRSRLALLKTSRVNWKKGLVARACEHAAKDAILTERTTVETSEMVAALMQRRSLQV